MRRVIRRATMVRIGSSPRRTVARCRTNSPAGPLTVSLPPTWRKWRRWCLVEPISARNSARRQMPHSRPPTSGPCSPSSAWRGGRWTTGSTGSRGRRAMCRPRYDMSRQINSISVPTVSEDGSRAGSMETADSTSFNMMVDANGVVDGYGAARQFSGRNLSEVIGKELAEKVMGEAEGGVLSGDGLKVGGEGMRAFYDSILPKAVNKWAKRMGGRVGRAAVPAGPADHLSLAYFQEWMQRNHPDVAQPTIADEWSQGEDSPLVSEFLADSRLIESHSLDVTDAMRDSVSQGMTLFQSQLGDRLVAVHNLSAKNLLFSDNLGGLPAPSIGITKAASPFRGFGSISLIGGRALAEPGTTNPVFSADAYTQRLTEILSPKVRVKKADAFIDSIDPVGWNLGVSAYLTCNH